MVWRVWLIALLMTFLSAAQEIHLKARSFSAAPAAIRAVGQGSLLVSQSVSQSAGRLARQQTPTHRIVTFDHAPNSTDVEALLDAGLKVLSFVPDNSLMVSGVGGPDGVELTTQDKLSSALVPGSPTPLIIEFHSDVGTPRQDAILNELGMVSTRPGNGNAAHLIAAVASEKLVALASHDEVAYIFPAGIDLLEAGGPETGGPEIGGRMINWMNCVGMLTTSGPVAQYAGSVHGWSADSASQVILNYHFGTLTTQVPESSVKQEILRAFNEWSRNTGVVFQAGANAGSPRTINIKFATGSHGDYWPFTSPATVAHTFYPVPVNAEPSAGDMHLNNAENWNAGADLDIFSVVLHETGHALGLQHSDQPGDVMYPYYRRGMQLSANDIRAVRALYGPPRPQVVPTAAAPAIPEIRLSVNPLPATTQRDRTDISGFVAGGVAPMGLQWQTDHGRSGSLTVGSGGTWSGSDLPLETGTNTITVSAFDSAHQTVTETAAVTRLLTNPAAGTAPVTLKVIYPASYVFSTDKASLAISGTASGGTGVNQIVWQTAAGASGIANGTTNWSVPSVPLMTGTNTILLRAVDAKGASAWASLVVTRR